MRKNVIFYHFLSIETRIKSGRYLFGETFKNIVQSDLYENTEEIYVNMVGDSSLVKTDYDFLSKEYKNYTKLNFVFHKDQAFHDYLSSITQSEKRKDGWLRFDHLGGENDTISLIQNYCKKNDDANILYLHVKGITQNTKKTSDHREAWRKSMEDYVINKWRHCVKELETKELTGTRYLNAPLPHFSGNFWWGRSDYLKNLISPLELVMKNKEIYKNAEDKNSSLIKLICCHHHIAEFWCAGAKKYSNK